MVGFGDIGQKLAELLTDAGEEVCVIDTAERPGVNIVGDLLDRLTASSAPARLLPHAEKLSVKAEVFREKFLAKKLLAKTERRTPLYRGRRCPCAP